MQPRRNRLRPKTKPPFTVTGPALRYPSRAVIDAMLGAMLTECRADPAVSGSGTVHFWGFARAADPATHDMAHTAVTIDPEAARSPILESAEWLLRRFGGRLWAFGLAHRTSGELVVEAGAAQRGSDVEWSDLCTATIFDARARAYTALSYLHLPELGQTPTRVHDTREATETWIELFDRRAPAAHAWAAAITLDPCANRAAIARLRSV
ncbi:hypothetical protein [Nocardia amikacinitolerans]|uniref:hypothetical protein n=1 Tax=Nocardia amikacinitolerans TaxID=756689 RepID=UPI0020A4BE67|nr:hypothetical protein [Nocardia amikacinitolerans]MCP2291649.1 hypothetical protein [Nocardia amikacinitolerans]